MNYRQTPCKGCGAPVVYARNTVTGRTVPLDMNLKAIPADAKVRGHVYLLDYEDGALVAHPLKGDQGQSAFNNARDGVPTEKPIGVSHFRTCPEAGKFSKGAKR